jgi:hypothetical protein
MKIKIFIVAFLAIFIVHSILSRMYPGLLVYHLNSQGCFSTVCAKSQFFVVPIFDSPHSGCLWYFSDKFYCAIVYYDYNHLDEILTNSIARLSFGDNKYDVYFVEVKINLEKKTNHVYYKMEGFPIIIEGVLHTDDMLETILSTGFYYK